MKTIELLLRMRISIFTILISGIVMQPSFLYAGTELSPAKVIFLARKHNNINLGLVRTVNNVIPGDIIEVDIYLADWADSAFDGLRAYQITLDSGSFLSEDCGNLIPYGWDAPVERQGCGARSECSDGSVNPQPFCCNDNDCIGGVCEPSPDCLEEDFPLCNSCPNIDGPPKCTGYDFDPARGSFIKEKHCSDNSSNAGDYCESNNMCLGGICIENPEYVFAGIQPRIIGAPTITLDHYQYGGALFIDQVIDEGTPRYAGTIILQADQEAKGIFRIGINPGFHVSFIEDLSNNDKILISEPLKIVMAERCGDRHTYSNCQVEKSNPPSCAIDARYPHDPFEYRDRYGWDHIDLTFNEECEFVNAFSINDFILSINGRYEYTDGIADVTFLGHQTVRVTFQYGILPIRWTCLQPTINNRYFLDPICLGMLPGDVNSDSISSANDVQTLKNFLNGHGPQLNLWQCDADRNGVCNSADVKAVVEMQNGDNDFIPYIDRQLTLPCPRNTYSK